MASVLFKKVRHGHRHNSKTPQAKHNDHLEFGLDKEQAEGERTRPNEDRGGAQSSHTVSLRQADEENRAMRKYRWRLIAGLFLPCTVQAFNQTIIAAALPFIASDFRTEDPRLASERLEDC